MWSWPANRDEGWGREWKTALSRVFNLVGPFSFSLRLSFSLSLSLSSSLPSPLSLFLSLYIYVYLFFLFLFKFVFSSPLFVPLVSFKSQESSWLIFWCTLCLMYGVKSCVYRRRLMCWAGWRCDIFLQCVSYRDYTVLQDELRVYLFILGVFCTIFSENGVEFESLFVHYVYEKHC